MPATPYTLPPHTPLVIASHNRGKILEFTRLLQPLQCVLSSAAEHGLPEPEETGSSFAANAALKARAAAQASGRVALADDSGLAVDALHGDPGIYSARWAGPQRDFTLAMHKVISLLAPHTNRRAQFITQLALCWPDGTLRLFEGSVAGTITSSPRGNGGFGYDPIFMPDGYTETFGELPATVKDQLSHRARACAALVAAFTTAA